MTPTFAPAPAFAYIGCFTTAKRRARGDGIHVYHTRPGDQAWTHLQHLPDLVNPSYLVMAPDRATLYAVHGDQDYASAYARHPVTGLLRPLGQAAAGGTNVVHGALGPAGRHFIVANYATGTVAVLPVAPGGALAPFTQCLPMPGTPGPHRTEQAASHPHQIVFDPTGRFVLVPDKGNDTVCVFAFDEASGTLELASSVASRPGAGPRHGAFHPTLPIYWCLNELDSTITTYRWSNNGILQPLQVLTTLPPGFFGASTAAAIAIGPGGSRLFASNRGQDGIACFATDPGTGQLSPLGWATAPGSDPRFMTIHDGHLYVASERDDVIGLYELADPLPASRPVATSPSPVSIAFA